jgi:hypothetical protein
VEQLSAGSGAEGVQALLKPAFELIGPHEVQTLALGYGSSSWALHN